MKLDLDLPLEAWHIVDELLAEYESWIGVWMTDIDPLEVIQEVRRSIAKMESPR